jgi:hypothetical protein
MAKLGEKGSPHTFLAVKPAEPPTHITALRQEVLDATKVALDKDKAQQHAHAIPLPLAFEWALQGGGRGGTSRREAIVAVMEALAASEAFWQYAKMPALQYDVCARWEAVVGRLPMGPYTARLQQLLGTVRAKAATDPA